MNVQLLDKCHPEQELELGCGPLPILGANPNANSDATAAQPKRFACSRPLCITAGLGAFGVTVAVVVCVIFATISTTPLPSPPAATNSTARLNSTTQLQGQPIASRPTFLVVGDSITQNGGDVDGWATRLQASYIRSVDVINRGLSGYSTRTFVENAMPVVSRELETAFAPVLITLWYGANDAALADGPDGRKHVPQDEYRSNLVKILNEFQRVAPQAKVLVVSPPAVDDATRRSRQVAAGGKSDPIDRTNAQAGDYAMACGGAVQSVAESVGSDRVSFLDMHSYMMTAYDNATARAALFSDGLHLSAEGNRVVFEQVRDRVELLVPKEALETPQIPLV